MELQITWFVLWGVLWGVYFMLDGFVLGTGFMSAFLAKSDTEKRVLINTVGPVWDGNEVWLVTAGGATFAAFPTTYALMFSNLYTALLLLLFALIVRGLPSSSAARSTARPGKRAGIPRWSSRASCRHSCSAWPSATSSRVCRCATTLPLETSNTSATS